MATHVYLTTLAAIFIVTFGTLISPLIVALARLCLPVAARAACFVAKAANAAIKPVLKQVRRYILAVAMSGAALSLLVAAVIATPATAQAPLDKAQVAVTKSIERMIGILDKVAKNPVVQGAKVIARGFTAVKVYRLSKEVKGLKTDVAALNASVYQVLLNITGIIERIELGETLTAAELDAVNARIDVHAVQIAAAEAEIELLKLRMDESERKQRETDRRQRDFERQQRDADQRQREADTRQRETNMRVAAQQKKTGRDSKTQLHFFDPKCQCRPDIRDRDTPGGQVTATAGR